LLIHSVRGAAKYGDANIEWRFPAYAGLTRASLNIHFDLTAEFILSHLYRKEFGLGMFLNPSMLRAVRPKELRKMLGHFMKLNQGLIAPGQKQVTPLQAKLHYMKIVSELRSFGGKCFLATLVVRPQLALLVTSGSLVYM